MSLETAVHINDLNAANPTAADPKSQGDDHIRNLKASLKNDLAGFTGSILVAGVDGGVANAYTLTPANPIPGYGLKMTAIIAPTVANTGASTLNVSGLGVKALLSVAGQPLVGGDLTVGTIYSAFYDGAQFRLLSITKNYADQLSFASSLPAQPGGTHPAVLRSTGGVAAWGENGVKGADIASAATINLATATGDFVHVTGATTITAITIPVGAECTVVFDAALTLTHSAALLLPGLLNVVTAAGDRMIVRGDTAGANVVSYTRASGRAVATQPGGLQVVTASGPFTVPATDFEVELIGGGQAGGRDSVAGDGGVAGSTVIKRFSGAVIGSTATFVAGSAGTGLVSSLGAPGGNSSFTLAGFTTLLAGGGGSVIDGNGIRGPGPATGGDINIIGQRGTRPAATGGADYIGGDGGSTRYGFGGVASGVSSAMAAATGFGAGGGAGTAATGVPIGGNGPGGPGVAIIRY